MVSFQLRLILIFVKPCGITTESDQHFLCFSVRNFFFSLELSKFIFTFFNIETVICFLRNVILRIFIAFSTDIANET